MTLTKNTCAIVALLFALSLPGDAGASGNVSAFGPEKPLSLADLKPHLSDSEWYKEHWNHNAWSSDGHYIAVDFVISNIGVGDRKGSYKAMFKNPEGKKFVCRGELDSDEWNWDRKGYGLKFGKVQVKGDLETMDITVRCKKVKMDLRFSNKGASYKPGDGILRFADKGSYLKHFPSARSRVTGTVEAGGEKTKIDAPGTIEHGLFTLAPHEFSQRWFKFKKVNSESTIMLVELQTPDEYSRARRGWAMVYDENGRLVATNKVSFEYEGFIEDKRSPQKYKIPRRVKLAAVDGSTHLTGSLTMTAMKKAKDPTAKWNTVMRAMARRYSKPMDYSIACKYSLRVKNSSLDRTFSGEGVFRFAYLNP